MSHRVDSSSNDEESTLHVEQIDTPDGVEAAYDVVYMPDEGVLGIIMKHGAYVSRVYYVKDGMTYDVDILNEDLEPM